ncbi:hypothetical protein KGQ64_06985 [bacterium]|nr:hypothetical protein [bacterium]
MARLVAFLLPVVGSALIALAIAACGGDDICLSGSCDPDTSPTPSYTVSVTGNVSRFTTLVSDPTTVTVIVCVGLAEGADASACPKSFLAQLTSNFTFARSGIEPGSEAIFFWIDEDQNGEIDPGDPLARLSDPNGRLRAVGSGEQVSVTNAVVDFPVQVATATITVGRSPTPTPAPQPTP